MKNCIKKIGMATIASIVTLGLFTVVSQRVEAQNTLSASITRQVTPWYGEDQSTYATQNHREGLIVRHYRFDVHGGAIGDINLGPALPNGAYVIDTWVDVTGALLPTNGTAGIEFGTTDLFSPTNSLESAAITHYTNDFAIANATSYIVMDVVGTAYTSGTFSVYSKYILTNP